MFEVTEEQGHPSNIKENEVIRRSDLRSIAKVVQDVAPDAIAEAFRLQQVDPPARAQEAD